MRVGTYEGQIVRNSMNFVQVSQQDEHSKPSGHHSHNSRLYSASSSFLNLLFYGTYCGKLTTVTHQQSQTFSAKVNTKKGGGVTDYELSPKKIYAFPKTSMR